jgi:hypothetical protein
MGDVPPISKVFFGKLVWYLIRNGRPMVGLKVACDCSFAKHTYPWRHNWPVSADVVSVQPAYCPRRRGLPIRLALASSQMTASEEVWLEAAVAYEAWKAAWVSMNSKERRAARKTRRAGGRPSDGSPVAGGPDGERREREVLPPECH